MEILTTIDSLEDAVEAHGQAILRYCHLLLRDFHEAQDAVQTVFMRAYATAKYDKALLYKIAYNQCMDVIRKRKRLFTFMEQEKRDIAEFYTMDEGISDELSTALGTLTPADRALVINRIVDGFDYTELSQIYGTSSPALRKRYERAKKKLAEELKKQGFRTEGENGQK